MARDIVAIRILFEYGADPDVVSTDGSANLLLATIEHHSHYDVPNTIEVLTVLLEHGSDPNLAHTVTGHLPNSVDIFFFQLGFV